MLYTKSLVEAGASFKQSSSLHSHTLQIVPTRGSTTPMKNDGFTPYGHQGMPVMGRPKFNDYLKARANYMQSDRYIT